MAGMGWINGLLDHFGIRIYREKAYSHSLLSYSQEGEDMILRRIFDDRQKGFYVDVGAHHPQRFSNTYFFYVRGWRGINIDAMPGCMDLFNAIRPNDINIEAAIAGERRELIYFMFDDPALNSFDEALSRSRDKTAYNIIGERAFFTKTLAEVLDEHLPPDQRIDFLSIDVEGLDLEVLESNNWARYRPCCVLAECAGYSLEEIEKNAVRQYLRERDYDLFAKTANTFIFKSAI
ncbi:MAG: FkbM family methyltransferase [Blastocatellales bacterium]